MHEHEFLINLLHIRNAIKMVNKYIKIKDAPVKSKVAKHIFGRPNASTAHVQAAQTDHALHPVAVRD